MKVIGFAAYSGSGKTTLVERLIGLLRERGLRVAVVKHAHHLFDIDQPGKDSFRHRVAGASQVLIASAKRSALMREYDEAAAPDVHALLAQLDPSMDWVLVEGFKQSNLPKMEIWRPSAMPREGAAPAQLRYPHDSAIVAVATDAPASLPQPVALPVLNLNDPDSIVEWMVNHGGRFDYSPPAPQ